MSQAISSPPSPSWHAVVITSQVGPQWVPGGPHQPTAMLPLLGSPVINITLQWLASQTKNEITLISRERPDLFSRPISPLTPVPNDIIHCLEHQHGKTFGILRRIAHKHPGSLLLVEQGVHTTLDIQALWDAHRRTGATMTSVVVAGKPAGISIIETQALLDLPENHDESGAAIMKTLREKSALVRHFSWNGPCFSISHASSYEHLLRKALDTHIQGIYTADTARVHPQAKLHPPVYIGPGVHIEADTEIGPYACLEAQSFVARGSRLKNCQLLPYTRLTPGGHWHDGLLFPHGFTPFNEAPNPSMEAHASEYLDSTWQEPFKERFHTGLDQFLAAILLLMVAPLWLVIITLIKLDSPGPAFFTQLRSGRDPRPYRLGAPRGKVFACYKFRTMVTDAEGQVQALRAQNHYGEGAFFKLSQDPRITRVGAFLRKTSLDELPQLINVLKGEMRLVGNRPLPLYEAAALQEDWQRTRFLAPAGITGLWQISGRSDLSEKERLVLDSYYSVTRTFWGDWMILLRTLPALLRQRGAR